ncbi:TetR/AcrR family transcriptional regulator [uncultured Litoreibacter sp.]|uniref:TetR/AcrR family transcriptional regulator n=1 Tax=uncultured Litoreibacter sp. TaxID=1392394 RepID=UPI00262A86EF|nr:TetR/AcrR family transcriptional regulator [uncultured Litoreibacter sp.]
MGRRKSYDRTDVLTKAMHLFWAKGYEGAHLSELVDVTGLNRFGLYSEFGGKEGLFQEALDLYLKSARTAYRDVLSVEPMGIGNIRSYFQSIRFGDDYHGCFLINTLTDKHTVSEVAFDAAQAVHKEAHALFLRNLEAAQASGELPPDRDPRVLANLLSALDSGLSIRGIVSPSEREKDKVAEEALRLLTSFG